MKNLNIENIARAVGGRVIYPAACNNSAQTAAAEASAVIIDSRKCEPGAVFIATKGEKADGHSFVGQVFAKGALAAIVEYIPEELKPVYEETSDGKCGPLIVVQNSFEALKALAAYYRTVMKHVRIVGIVGSVGKTSTKELVASVLEQKFKVLKTEGNYNNEVGVPLTILRIRDEHETAVVEMGISDFGEMDRLGAIVRPDAVVMTNIGPCHLERLGDLDGVLKAKSEVIPYISDRGILCVNAEDPRLASINVNADRLRRVSYGDGGDVYAENFKGCGYEGSTFTVHALVRDGAATDADDADMSFDAECRLPGIHMMRNALAATAIGICFGMNADEIQRGIEAAQPFKGRGLVTDNGQWRIVDDTYNANPKSMCAGIDIMRETKGRRVAILGDMFELGSDAPRLHAEVGAYAAVNGIDRLIAIGELAVNIYDAYVKNGGREAYYFKNTNEFFAALPGLNPAPEDTVLVKASHGMHFETIVNRLTAAD